MIEAGMAFSYVRDLPVMLYWNDLDFRIPEIVEATCISLIHACVLIIDTWLIGQYYVHAVFLMMYPAYKTLNDICNAALDLVSTRCRFIMIPR